MKRSRCNTLERRPKNISAELDRNILWKLGQQLRSHYEKCIEDEVPASLMNVLAQLEKKS